MKVNITDEQWIALALLFGEPELEDTVGWTFEQRWATAEEMRRFDKAVVTVQLVDSEHYTLQDLRAVFDAYRRWLRKNRKARVTQ